MDLISVKREYRNRKNIVIAISVLIVIIVFVWLGLKINSNTQNDITKTAETEKNETIQEAEQEEQRKQEEAKKEEAKKEEERKAKLPQLTDEGRNNLKNIYHSETKRVFLTFDDGPSRTVTPVVLDTLKSENIKATFFLLGSRVELDPDLVKREYDEGHYIASHGYSHVYSQIYATPQSVLDEYNKSVTAIRNAIGEQEYNPHLFRFPGGYWGGKYAEVKKQAEQILEQNDVLHIDWNALTSDAAGAKTTEQFIAELNKTVPKHNSIVVLMHDAGNKTATANALPTIIKYFRDQGFEFENFYSIIK